LQPEVPLAAQAQGDAAATQGQVLGVVIDVVEVLDMAPQCLLQQRVPQEARLVLFRQGQLEFDFFSHAFSAYS
jgi:hypothetical protein